MTATTSAAADAATQRAGRVSAWRATLSSAGALSWRFADRYAVVLAQLERDAPPKTVEAALATAVHDPGAAVALLAGTPRPPAQETQGGSNPAVGGAGPVVSLVRDLVARHPDVTRFVEAQPRLEQTAVPIHPSRQAHLVRAASHELVALRWPAESVAARSRHQSRIKPALSAASRAAPLSIKAHDEYAVVDVPDGDPWVFAPNLGRTLEDRLRSRDLDATQRSALVESLAALRAAMTDQGLVWQGFAPRNMFLRGGQVVLIDFEESVDASQDPARAAECLLWHRVFFADCLTAEETVRLFAPVDGGPDVPDDYPMPADDFERALLGVDMVTWRQRRELLEASVALEGRHTRPTRDRDSGVLHGHELGHFWGDFIPVELEVRLFRHLTAVAEPAQLVACLEAFEAAMEADICRSLRRHASGMPDPSAPRTAALVEALDAIGVERLAAHRMEAEHWYQRLTTDPGRLVDELLYSAGTAIGGLDRELLDTYLVGSGAARKGHEESLAAATRIGLDFVHRADDGEPYLRYRSPTDLASLLDRPLPSEGSDLDAVLADLEAKIVPYSVSQSHPRYLAFPDSGNAIAAMAGGLLGRLLNQNLIAVDRSAPAATFVEIQVIEWLRDLVGYESAPLTDLRGVKDVAGLWATGGHLSNHLAILVALGRRFPEVRRHGLPAMGTRPTVVMAGPIAHYSHSDAAFHLGLGWDGIVNVGARSGYTTDPAAVEAALADPPAGTTPFMVVGVAGNCRTTGLDDLATLAEICRRHGVWFHVDACHGGSLIFSERLRRRHLAGIEHADSVSLDPHKGLFTPYPSSYVLFRQRGVLTQFSRHETAVMADDCWDLGLITPFLGSRGFESLATWTLLRHVGVRRLGDLVESRQAHVRYLERRIDETGLFISLNDVDFYRLAFVLCPPTIRQAIRALPPERRRHAARVVSQYTSRLNAMLYQSGEVCFDEHTLADLADRIGAGADISYTIMAACPGNPLITQADLDRAVEYLTHAARPLVPAMLADITGARPAGGTGRPTVAGPAGWSDVP
ncbi:pyridoxal-dependent decarboxylase [Phytohabitans rumicis]|uniref:Aspartate aminotransferase family protein n=1 Tax=Phytohabitans rumicis TaxID=1076125 RepID=A0A6V8KYV7_9ACTN|nr:pyridoxal-dependent decarboxylase [Phytohabitans rumicis]GFJ90292.1 hypothetical protein Prum_039340 [Phytohabitans rumicis]